MNIFESISSALKSIYGNKMRSVLTMLGIIIGIGSVIMITSVGQGVKDMVFNSLNNMDKRIIQVYPKSTSSYDDMLDPDDAAAIEKINGISRVTLIRQGVYATVDLLRPDKTKSGSILGADENYGILESAEIQRGRFISQNDVANGSKVAVLQPYVAVQIFGYVDCVGETIELDIWGAKEEYTIIGILKGDTTPSAMDEMGTTPLKSALVTVPYTSLDQYYDNGDSVDFFAVSIDKDRGTQDMSKLITVILDVRHNSTDNYYAESLESGFDQINIILNGITAFIAFVAAISLFVGGVGVMNIMLVSVKERTREIGIRKSLGATEGNIKFQFLLESVTLSLIGGIMGIILGQLLARAAGTFMSNSMNAEIIPSISLINIALACGVSTLVGIAFGVYPAGKAAKLDPIEALRYE